MIPEDCSKTDPYIGLQHGIRSMLDYAAPELLELQKQQQHIQLKLRKHATSMLFDYIKYIFDVEGITEIYFSYSYIKMKYEGKTISPIKYEQWGVWLDSTVTPGPYLAASVAERFSNTEKAIWELNRKITNPLMVELLVQSLGPEISVRVTKECITVDDIQV